MKNNELYEAKYPFLNPKLALMDRIEDLISRMTLDEKISMIPTKEGKVERLGIKAYNIGGEAAHGVVSKLGPATVFPQPQGLSSTFDSELMKEIGSVIGDEARIYYKKNNEEGGLTLWAPTIDMERDPRWGRTEEAYGEDPYLTGILSSNLIKGMQGEGEFYLKLVPAPKHFYGNNNEEGRIFSSSSIDPRNKHEYYLKAFEKAYTEGKAYSMMTAYNEINGRPCLLNHEVKDIVKGQWGCDGFVVCDGGDMSQTVEFHKYYKSHAETIANAIKNGVDVMTDDKELVIASTKEAIERGLLSEDELNDAIRNIFKVRFKLGQFDPDELNPYANIPQSLLNSEKHRELAKKVAREAIVLLKNSENILPLKKDNLSKVAVIGPLADVVYKDWYTGMYQYKITPLQGIVNKLGIDKVSYVSGNDEVKILDLKHDKYLKTDYQNSKLQLSDESDENGQIFELSDWGWESCTLKAKETDKYLTTDDKEIFASSDEVFGWFVREVFKIYQTEENISEIKTWNGKGLELDKEGYYKVKDDTKSCNDKLSEGFKIEKVTDGIKEAVEAARNSEVAIVFVGNNPVINGKEEIDRVDITLASAQEKLVKEVHKVNPNTIVVIVGSYPFAINYIDENIPAIIYTAHGCQELGSAISDVLFGEYSPAGRLSMTWYKSIDELPSINDYDIIKSGRTYMYYQGNPLYSFGHGLTYTSFKYSNLVLSRENVNGDEELKISLDVENVGKYDSDEIVQLYIKANNSKVKRPLKELKGFKRIKLNIGEKRKVEFTIKVGELAFWDVRTDSFLVESGQYSIMIGSSSKDIRLEKFLNVHGRELNNRLCNKEILAENYDDYESVRLVEWLPGEDCVLSISDYSYLRFNDIEFIKDISHFEAKLSITEEGFIELLLDSLDGRSICRSELNKGKNNACSENLKFKIEEVLGVHDLYIKLSKNTKLRSFLLSR